MSFVDLFIRLHFMDFKIYKNIQYIYQKKLPLHCIFYIYIIHKL